MSEKKDKMMSSITRQLMLVILSVISAAWLFTAYDWASKISEQNAAIIRAINTRLSDHDRRLSGIASSSSHQSKEISDSKRHVSEHTEQMNRIISSLELRKMEIRGLAKHIKSNNGLQNAVFPLLLLLLTSSRAGLMS